MNENGKIKAGYGFELRVKTNYLTDRNTIPGPSPYNSDWVPSVRKPYGGYRGGGYCDWATRSPGISPVDAPNQIYLTMPYQVGGKNVCYILRGTSSGPWYNKTTTFQLPTRSDLGEGNTNKIYINEDARPGTYNLSIITPRWNGYYPDSPISTSNKRTLQDCKYVNIQILPQDDLKDHIVQ